MSKNPANFDGYPSREAKKLRRLDSDEIVREIALRTMDHFIDGDKNGIVTWVDEEESLDGHALALHDKPGNRLSLMYLRVDRYNERLVQRSSVDFHIPSESLGLAESYDRSEEAIEEAAFEFDADALLYTSAILDKIAYLGMVRAQNKNNKSVMNVLYADDDNLDELQALFPTEEIEILPYASEDFMEAVKGAAKKLKITGKGDETAYVRRHLSENETYVMALTFQDGKLSFGKFVQQTRDEIQCDLHNYQEYNNESIGLEQEWDEKKLIRTVKTGLLISKEAFDIYLNEALGLDQ